MTIRTSRHGMAVAVLSLATLALSGAAIADNHGGGGGGGGHSGGGGGGGGHAASHSGSGHAASHGGYAPRAPAYRGGGVGYYRAPATVGRTYSAPPSAHSWGTGYARPSGNVHAFAPSYGHGPWGRPGWHGRGYGLPFYSYVGVLPAFYSTFWWGGIPYYYGDSSYYLWNEGVGQYQVVPPPAPYDDSGQAAPSAQQGGAPTADPYVYPNNGQTPEQQSTDRYECHRWAVDQSGFDPTQANGGAAQAAASGGLDGYQRAESACLQGRGYTVR